MKIEIIRKGVFDQNGKPVPVGTLMNVKTEPVGWRNKYRVVPASKPGPKSQFVSNPENEKEVDQE